MRRNRGALQLLLIHQWAVYPLMNQLAIKMEDFF